MRRIEKAFAYITHCDKLLVFRHPNSPEAGIQVPAGTVEPGETPQHAALREAREETGLIDLVTHAELGQSTFDMSPFGRAEIHVRHFFHFLTGRGARATWRHLERHSSDGGLGTISTPPNKRS
jgi:8-oxo-dGTP pyrophosphatase MutT (NUDIX family)